MLEKPDIPENHILATLSDHYGITPHTLDFLPLGADPYTAVYKADTGEYTYFVKLRTSHFDQTAVRIPKLLHDHGISQIIPPLVSKFGDLSVKTEHYHMIVYPFIEGENGDDRPLSAHHWIELGQILRRMHDLALSDADRASIPRETFSPFYRDGVRRFQAKFAHESFTDPVSVEFAALINDKRREIDALVNHAETFAAQVQTRDLPFVLCHADIHIWNLLITQAGTLYVVDWDTLVLAPKERDLMFIGMGVLRTQPFSEAEQADLFYQGYGQREVDPTLIAYYQCERVVQDLYEYCQQNLDKPAASKDRPEGLRQLTGQFQPGAMVESALESVKRIPRVS